MTIDEIVSQIDTEISKLQQARAMLSAVPAPASAPAKKPVGHPKGINSTPPAKVAVKKRVMSDDARARIIAGQKKRWATAKK